MKEVNSNQVFRVLEREKGMRFSVREVSRRLGTKNIDKVSGMLDGMAFAGKIGYDEDNRLYFYKRKRR